MSEQLAFDLRSGREALGERRDCSVLAIVAATGRPYEEVHAALKAAGRKSRRGAYPVQLSAALKALGVRFQYRARRDIACHGISTTRDFAANFKTASARRFILFIPRHFTAFVDGHYSDWVRYVKRGRLVRCAWEVL